MQQRIRCPSCGNTVFAEPACSSTSVSCPVCQTIFAYKSRTSIFEESNDTTGASIRDRIRDAWPGIAIVIGFLGVSVSTSKLTYPMLGLLVAGIMAGTVRYWSLRHGRLIIGIVVFLVLFLYGWFDTRVEVWDSDRTHYVDTFHNWSGNHLYRRLEHFTADGLLMYSMKGPMAGTGKPHGKWETINWDMEPLGPNRNETTFYWYGEKISEGEWHLRNK